MGRPASDLDDYLEWQQRLENQQASGLSIDDFCLQEGISKSTYYRWADRLRERIPESIAGEHVDREKIESGSRTRAVRSDDRQENLALLRQRTRRPGRRRSF